MSHLIRDLVTGPGWSLHLELYGFHQPDGDPDVHEETESECGGPGDCPRPDEPFDGYWVFRVTGDNKLEEIHTHPLKTEPSAEEMRAMGAKWLASR